MERLTGEARDRVRAMSLWLVVLTTLVGVSVIAYATFVGFVLVAPTPVDGVAVTVGTSREIVVHYRLGGCDELDRIDVVESSQEIELRAYSRARRPLAGSNCPAIRHEGRSAVVLDEPLAGRTVRDGHHPVPGTDGDLGREVPIVDDERDLPG